MLRRFVNALPRNRSTITTLRPMSTTSMSSIYGPAIEPSNHANAKPTAADKVIKVTFVDREGRRHTVDGIVGQTLLQVSTNHHIGLRPDPTCGEDVACTSCHVIVSNECYNQFIQPSEDENDMLRYANNLSENSRLACQLVLEEGMNNLVVSLPPYTNTPSQIDSFFRV